MRSEDLENLKTAYPTSEDPETGSSKVLGVDTPEVRLLYDEIFNDLDDTIFGVGWWAPHPGTSRRILVSHYLLECIKSIGTNLIEAALHHLEAVDYWERESDFLANSVSRNKDGKLSVKIPPRRTPEEDLLPRMATLHVVGFFRALVGALDCLGASVIGVLALPIDLRHASLDRARKTLERATAQIQGNFRIKLNQIIEGAGPTGWLDWVIEFRNMVVHRGRRWPINQLLPRPVRILGPNGETIPRVMVVQHLPSDPYRSQVEAFVGQKPAPVLTEHGEATMRGAMASSLNLIRNVAEELMEVWKARRRDPSQIIQPKANWPNGLCLESTGFIGYEPTSVSYDPSWWISHRDMARQFRTAALVDDICHRWSSFD